LKNKIRVLYTILLVGETGVGKSSLLQFIANVLISGGIDDDSDVLDCTNKQTNQNQTNLAHLYEITSSNRMVVSTSIY